MHRIASDFGTLGWLAGTLLVTVSFAPQIRADEKSSQAENSVTAITESPITASDREHWSFRPLVRQAAPEVSNTGWVQNPLDRFVLAELARRGLQPQPAADRTTLLRRWSFTLTGLPPTPEQIDAFITDQRPDASERLIDRLLATPQFGERWAQHWLDLARFAETDGFEHDKIRPDAWRYRDWVIRAANDDLPYDRFVQLQLAGDELMPDDEAARIATAFCLCGPDMPDVNSQEERRHNLLNELTATIGSALLGLQFGCAQCHDHKYEPISQADFFRLRAVFEPAVQVKKDQSVSVLAERGGTPPPTFLLIHGEWNRPGVAVAPDFPRIANPVGEPFQPVALNANSSGRRLALARWLTQPNHPLTPRVIANRVWQFHFGSGLNDTPSDLGIAGDEPLQPELVDWLATELVDSGWSLKHLHRTIAASATFRQASRGSGPDWEQTLARDPQNRRWSRFPRRRLEGEAIRDAMLAAAGCLNLRPSGPGVMPPLPVELATTLLKNQWQVTPELGEHDRRSIYVFTRRNLRYPIFEAFDRPDANASCALRNRSTTAAQSLLLLNSQFSRTIADRMARDLMSRADDDTQRVRLAILRCLGREPTASEVQLLHEFFVTAPHVFTDAAPTNSAQNTAAAALADLCLALFNTNEFIYLD